MTTIDVDIRKVPRTVFEVDYNAPMGSSSDRKIPPNAVMVSHNMSTPPIPKPALVTPVRILTNPGNYRVRYDYPRVVSSVLAYLSHVPNKLPSEGSLSVLNLAHIPIEEKNGRYFLHENVAKRWRQWEDSITITVRLLQEYSDRILFAAKPALPSRVPFLTPFRTEGEAVRQARITQDLFVPWIALLRYSLSLMDSAQSAMPAWVNHLTDNHAPTDWIDELLKTPFWSSRKSTDRVGAVLASISEASATIEYRLMIQFAIPAYYLYRDKEDKKEFGIIKGVEPYFVKDTDYRYQLPEPEPEVYMDDSCDQVDDTSPTEAKYMVTFKGANQIPGETPEQFFKRRAIANDDKERRETNDQRRDRIQREVEFASHPVPNKKYAPLCFRWVMLPSSYGGKDYWARKPWDMSKAKKGWFEYSDAMRRYDSFNNEWDINRVWADYDKNESDIGDYDVDDQDPKMGSNPPPKKTQPELEEHERNDQIETIAQQTARTHWWTNGRIEEEDRITIEPDVLKARDIRHYLLNYFGCMIRLHEPREMSNSKIQIVQKLMGLPKSQYITDDVAHEDRVAWSRIESFAMDSVDEAGLASQLVLPRGVRLTVDSEDNDGGAGRYVIGREDAPADQYRIVVSSKLIVGFLISQLGEEVGDDFHKVAATLLVEHGFTFSTARPSTVPARDYVDRFCCGLGFRRSTWQPTWVDYQRYVSERDDILTSPRGRAAYEEGGIIWRIAMHARGLNVRAVISGPSSSSAARIGQFGTYCEDDALTENEINIICGVYLVYTDHESAASREKKRKLGHHEDLQTKKVSFFPTPNVWNSLGYWSEYDEELFQNRLSEIRGGNDLLTNAKFWKPHNRSLSKRAKLLRFRNSKLTILTAEEAEIQ